MKPDAILGRLTVLANEWKLANLQPQIGACRELLQRHDGIDVAVLGRFKAGKSSFLNHLSGRAVLPIGVVPLTAVITRLRYGQRDHAEVRFLDGKVASVPLEEIHLYVGENENPDNAKNVAVVEVALPELQPFAPLQFVDTPGLGSALAHNTAVALSWLPHVGAALLAVSSDAPLSERDLELLEELCRHTPRIVLLLTKADLLTEAQRAEVLSFVSSQLQRRAGGNAQVDGQDRPMAAVTDGQLPMFFYSVKPELAALKSALMAELLQPLVQHQSEAGGEIVLHKLNSLCSQMLNYLRVALAAATEAESARERLRSKLAEERGQLDLLRAELGVFARDQSAGALDASLSALQPIQSALRSRITAKLGGQFVAWNLRLPPLLAAWREWLNASLKRELAGVSRMHRGMFCAPLHRSQVSMTRTLQAFHDRLAGHVKAALGVALAPRTFSLEVREPEAPPVDVAYAFDAAFTTVGWLIPLKLFRRPIERALLRKARYEVEKNLSRLAAEWRDRIAVAIADLRRQTEAAARNELEALEQMLDQTPSSTSKLRGQIAELESLDIA